MGAAGGLLLGAAGARGWYDRALTHFDASEAKPKKDSRQAKGGGSRTFNPASR
jgi:hypothetical protein